MLSADTTTADPWALWAKSDADGRPHSLPGHLLDSVAVAELVWDEFMATGFTRVIDERLGHHGRAAFTLLCGWHDLGKASPAFQRKAAPGFPHLIERARLAGHDIPDSAPNSDGSWPHGRVSARIARDHLGAPDHWFGPILQGHHGRIEETRSWSGVLTRADRSSVGPSRWTTVQQDLAHRLAEAVGADLDSIARTPPPSRGHQLALSGFLVMTDWIASSLPGLDDEPYDLARARERARAAWRTLHLGTGWRASSALLTDDDGFTARFGFEPRPLQAETLAAARDLPAPGLLVVEAPMGEGKTEAALAATEALAGRFGLRGCLFAMPTQGTTDAMYTRVDAWTQSIEPGHWVNLIHGKRMQNEAWRATFTPPGLFDIGLDDPYGLTGCEAADATHASEWLTGKHRPLLAPFGVATVDHALLAATRAKFVMLRHAGLSGKVLVIDEVHSYDVYMTQFLHELLRWCADAGVPVILMSATLPPRQRQELIEAYAPSAPPAVTDGYPVITAVSVDGSLTQRVTTPWRDDLALDVDLLTQADCEGVDEIVAAADETTRNGGCALVVLNTVARAQETYRALVASGVPASLLHGRLTTRDRADRTAALLDRLGSRARRGDGRPERLVVVATQIAEQSFDVDADILISDLAPMDLLLQRAGRLHRHSRPTEDRPEGLRSPRLLVAGVGAARAGGPPAINRGAQAVYGLSTLLRCRALLGDGTRWALPSDVPGLVTAAYAPNIEVPPAWQGALAAAEAEERELAEARAARASEFRATVVDRLQPDATTLAGVNAMGRNDDDPAVVVRDGEDTTEVILVVRASDGLRTLRGTPLGHRGERAADPAITREILGDTVRLRAMHASGLTDAPPGFDVPTIRHHPVLELDAERFSASVPGLGTVRYDSETGLEVTRS